MSNNKDPSRDSPEQGGGGGGERSSHQSPRSHHHHHQSRSFDETRRRNHRTPPPQNLSFSPYHPTSSLSKTPPRSILRTSANNMPTPGSDEDLRKIGESPGDFLGLDLGPLDARGHRQEEEGDGTDEDEQEDGDRKRGVGSPIVPIASGLPSRRGSAMSSSTTFALDSNSRQRATNPNSHLNSVGWSPSNSGRSSLRLPGDPALRSYGSTISSRLHPNPITSTPQSARSTLGPSGSGSLRSSRLPTRPDSSGKSIRRLNLHGRSGSTGRSTIGPGGSGYGYGGNEEDDRDQDQVFDTTTILPGAEGGSHSRRYPKTAGLFSSTSSPFSNRDKKKALSRSGSIVSTTQSIAQSHLAASRPKTGFGGSFRLAGEPRTAVGDAFRRTGSAIQSVLSRSRVGSSYDDDIHRSDEDNSDDEGTARGRTMSERDRQEEVVSDARYGFGSQGHVRDPTLGEEPSSGSKFSGREENPGYEANGVRVWYSSYDSIDWLHDQIKDSVRHGKIEATARRSWRGKLWQVWDRSMGWVVVSLVGIVTALVAFLVIKIEAFLFDLKSGICTTSLWGLKNEEGCPDGGWREWNDLDLRWMNWLKSLYGGHHLEGAIYFAIAMALAILSSVLTIYLTASTRFESTPEGTFAPKAPARTDQKSPPTETTPLMHSTTAQDNLARMAPQPEGPPRKVLYFASGSGIPEVKTILSGFVIRGYLGGSTLFVKSFGLALSVASGMSLGKEGPFVHIACCVANIISRSFTKYELNEAKKREILSAACGAGVAVAFGAPIGGTLFSWEESSTYYPAKVMWRTFFCASIAALTLRALNPYGNGKLVLLEVTYTRDYHSNSIYVVAILLGLMGGIYGGVWSRCNIFWTSNVRAKTWLKTHPIVEVAMVSAITTLVSFPSVFNRMGGVEWVSSLFTECSGGEALCYSPARYWPVMQELASGFFVRAALACITFGIKLPAGIFVPSLAAGAAFGRILGISLQHLVHRFPHWTFLPAEDHIAPGVYALIGAAATLAGVTRTTVSLAVIVVELTGTLDYVVPVALAILAAKVSSDAILSEGIYDLVINLNDFPYLDCKKDHHFGSRSIYDVVDTDLPYLLVDEKHTVTTLRSKLANIVKAGHRDGCFPCLKRQEHSAGLGLVGILAVNELQHALDELEDDPNAPCNLLPNLDLFTGENSVHSSLLGITEDPYDLSVFIDQAPTIVLTNSPLELLSQMFNKLGTKAIIVVDAHGNFVGTVLKKGWLKFLKQIERHE